MDNRLRHNALAFIHNLTGAQTSVASGYLDEIISDRSFWTQIQENRRKHGGSSSWSWGVGPDLGAVLYVLCRLKEPQIVVETGVASGESSSFFLEALHKNRRGELHSMDPGWSAPGSSELLPGWLIPDHLRKRWQFIQGDSSSELMPLLQKLGPIDFFLHDSDHSYRNMFWEYQAAWSHLNSGGLLLAHNIDVNQAFPDFCRKSEVKGFSLENLGGVPKP